MLDPVEVVGEPDALDLALGELHEVVQDPLLVHVEVIHRRGGDIRLDDLAGGPLALLCGDVLLLIHGRDLLVDGGKCCKKIPHKK